MVFLSFFLQGGGTRYKEYHMNITHYILPGTQLTETDIRTLTKHTKASTSSLNLSVLLYLSSPIQTPYIVTEQWLIDSSAQQKLLPPDDYLVQLPPDSQDEQPSVDLQSEPNHQQRHGDSEGDGEPVTAETLPLESQEQTTSDTAVVGGVLANLSFWIDGGFDEMEVGSIRGFVGRHGAKVTKKKSSSNTHHLVPHGAVLDGSNLPVVTTCWIERCISVTFYANYRCYCSFADQLLRKTDSWISLRAFSSLRSSTLFQLRRW